MAEALRELHRLELLTAALPAASGGAGLGTEPGGHLALLQILSALGGGDLSLARLYEGHTNALILVTMFGDAEQLMQAARDAHEGMLFGVWNTGHPEVMRLEERGGGWMLIGGKDVLLRRGAWCDGRSLPQSFLAVDGR